MKSAGRMPLTRRVRAAEAAERLMPMRSGIG